MVGAVLVMLALVPFFVWPIPFSFMTLATLGSWLAIRESQYHPPCPPPPRDSAQSSMGRAQARLVREAPLAQLGSAPMQRCRRMRDVWTPSQKKSPEGVNARRDECARVRSVLDAVFDTLNPNVPVLLRALSLLCTVHTVLSVQYQRPGLRSHIGIVARRIFRLCFACRPNIL